MSNSVSDTPAGRFPKSAHLLKHSDFLRVYQQGRRHFSGNMTFFYLPTVSEAGESARRPSRARVGFTVPKALGGAVERNRMRRRAREAAREGGGREGGGGEKSSRNVARAAGGGVVRQYICRKRGPQFDP